MSTRDQLTSQAVTDAPAANFVDELIAAYPDAKVILTTRESSTKWLASLERIYWQLLEWPHFYYASLIHEVCAFCPCPRS